MTGESNSAKVLVIVPAYNEEKNIGSVIGSIRKNFPGKDIAIINDGSGDATEAVARATGVKVISLPYNSGIGIAEQTGYKYAYIENYDIVVRIDADGQHDARFINECIRPLIDNSADMVIGSRYLRDGGFKSSISRRIGIRWICILLKLLTGVRISDPTSGFRAVNRKLLNFFCNFYPTDYPEPESILFASKSGFKIKDVPVIMKERQEGRSSINLWKAIYYMFKVTVALIIDESKIMRRKKQWTYG